jgi:hypothetical protein
MIESDRPVTKGGFWAASLVSSKELGLIVITRDYVLKTNFSRIYNESTFRYRIRIHFSNSIRFMSDSKSG